MTTDYVTDIATKKGMLASAATVKLVATMLREKAVAKVVVDPVRLFRLL